MGPQGAESTHELRPRPLRRPLPGGVVLSRSAKRTRYGQRLALKFRIDVGTARSAHQAALADRRLPTAAHARARGSGGESFSTRRGAACGPAPVRARRRRGRVRCAQRAGFRTDVCCTSPHPRARHMKTPGMPGIRSFASSAIWSDDLRGRLETASADM